MFTRTFQKLSKRDVGIAGGKGASLGEMAGAGLPVPPGFVILAGTFDYFLEKTNLAEKIEAMLKKVKHTDSKSVDKASKDIRGLIAKVKMPQDLQIAIQADFKNLKAKFVAVRSSATAEDSKDASWAGELNTYLNIEEKGLIEAVKKCWGSLFTSRAIFYRFEKKFQKQKVSVAVVVQKMVQSEISGISFTVHPVTKDKNQMVIEAGFGLGEAIVGGLVTPDSYIVNKQNLSLMDINVSTQNFAIIKSQNGNIHKKLGKEGSKQKLQIKQITELAKICKNIEKHYKSPQDIEWAFEKGKFYITQSRPITTL